MAIQCSSSKKDSELPEQVQPLRAVFDPRPLSAAVGSVVRKRLGVKPQRLHGTFVIPLEDMPKLKRLREKYGLGEPVKDEGVDPTM